MLIENLWYKEEVIGKLYILMYDQKETTIRIERSHEGYSHWAQWYMKVNGKIKKDAKKKEELEEYGKVMFLDMIADKVLEIQDRK